MKRLIYVLIVAVSLPVLNGCTDFLNVEPLTNESGNNYWGNKKNVEEFTRGLYDKFRTKVIFDFMLPMAGDLRAGPWIQTKGNHSNRDYIGQLARNDLNTLLASDEWWISSFNMKGNTIWAGYYQVIQGANLAHDQIAKMDDPSFGEKSRKEYEAEAVFLRCISYFFMVRNFGDVPYYTNAYESQALPRMDMDSILLNCINDLAPVTEDLPWTYNDPAKRAVRAMRGSALVLQMHMYMWLAGFDDANKEKYWKAVDSLGAHLLNDNQGAYELLPISRISEVFDGRTKEGLFEIPQNLNYGESFGYNTLSDMLLHYPHKQPKSNDISYMYPEPKFLDKIFPPGKADGRVDAWFLPDEMHATDGKFEYLKYVSIFAREGEDVNPDDNMMIFRLPDVILLRAEALNDLGKVDEAKKMLNMVRQRAHATPYSGNGGKDLSDEIYWERCRELLGEHMYYYTLVRTKRILDDKYCWHPMPAGAFKEGAWTWPIDPSALTDNPKMTLNTYWTR